MSQYDLVIIGLTLSSSWGNGHATTYRALLRGLAAEGANVLFLERDVPWYASNRDLPQPDFCKLELVASTDDLFERFGADIAGAGAVIVGSYVPDGPKVIDRLASQRLRLLGFYDIDTPVTLAKLDRGDEEYLRRDQVPVFDVYFSFSGGAMLDRLETRYGARRALPLYCSVDEARYHPVDTEKQWDLGYLGTYSPDRQPTLETLLIEPARRLPDMRFVVAGPQYPADIDWPANVERIEHLPPAEHNPFYNRQRFTLNVTRADMIAAGWSPSVRLFEAGACGTPVISDTWRGLDDFFPVGDAILTARSSDEVIALLLEVDEARRSAIASAARRITMQGHTGAARGRQLLNDISQLDRAAATAPRTPVPV
jgi:spore maturation protein CgeB